jgi:hypothetical protein
MSMALAVAAGACHDGSRVEPGAVLLTLSVVAGAPTPDELRISVYDDTGSLWKDARVPATGALAPESASRLGTILIQPGATAGDLRVHGRGLAGGARILEGVLVIPAGKRGTFDLVLDTAVPADQDGDGVPDGIDDCPAVSDADQKGCPVAGSDAASDAATDAATDAAKDGSDARAPGDAGDVRDAGDAGTDAGVNCDLAGACQKAKGAVCATDIECASSFCVDGICCANACAGPCRSCNQPNNDGVCLAYAQGTDPAGECAIGSACNGAGACGPPAVGGKKNGELCAGAGECATGFCADGVCCNTACTAACRTCATGTCANVTRKQDLPECAGAMTCNPSGKCVAQ